jgi:predicted dehydrogenase
MKYKVGIVGLGRIGAMFEKDCLREKPASHIGAFNAVEECKVAAVCDVQEEKCKAVAKEWNVPHYYTDFRQMVAEHEFDVVSVATPHSTHADIVCHLAQTGKVKAVFCEKPLASTVEDAARMVSVCRLNRVALIVNHTRRWSQTYAKIKSIIDSKTYGDLVKIVGFASREKDFQGNIHMFDLLNFLTDGKRKLWAYVDCPVNYLVFELQIILTDGKIEALDNGRKVTVYRKAPSFRYKGINELSAVDKLPPYSFSEAMINAVKNIVNCLEGKEKPLCTGETGLEALRTYSRWRENEE